MPFVQLVVPIGQITSTIDKFQAFDGFRGS